MAIGKKLKWWRRLWSLGFFSKQLRWSQTVRKDVMKVQLRQSKWFCRTQEFFCMIVHLRCEVWLVGIFSHLDCPDSLACSKKVISNNPDNWYESDYHTLQCMETSLKEPLKKRSNVFRLCWRCKQAASSRKPWLTKIPISLWAVWKAKKVRFYSISSLLVKTALRWLEIVLRIFVSKNGLTLFVLLLPLW